MAQTEVRIEIRVFDDGFARAAMQLPGTTEWAVLATVLAEAYARSEEVRVNMMLLAQGCVKQICADAIPDARVDGVTWHMPAGGETH